MKKNKNTPVKPYHFEAENTPSCVCEPILYGEVSEELKNLIDERLAAIENGTMEFVSNDDVERECRLRRQAHRRSKAVS